ncbi:MAG: hypothetical protein [Microvirus sp.]|nr:MAG: hypothetical protein [Microvirus sp.]
MENNLNYKKHTLECNLHTNVIEWLGNESEVNGMSETEFLTVLLTSVYLNYVYNKKLEENEIQKKV